MGGSLLPLALSEMTEQVKKRGEKDRWPIEGLGKGHVQSFDKISELWS